MSVTRDDQSTIRIYRASHKLLKDSARFFDLNMVEVIQESLSLWIAAKRESDPVFGAYLDNRHQA